MNEAIFDAERDRITQIFAAEARESLAVMEQAVVAIEARLDDADALNTLFREAHTLKGNGSALEFVALTGLAHVLEDLLDRRRDGRLAFSKDHVSLLIESIDALGELVDAALAGDATNAPAHVERLIERLTVSKGAESAVAAHEAPDAGPAASTAAPSAAAPRPRRTLRVDVDRLDAMLNLTGEIAVAQSRLRRLLADGASGEMTLDTHQQLDRLSSELQTLVLKVRMVPLGPLFHEYRRMARELGRVCDKPVTVELRGETVEADTGVIESLRDPLMHLIRNAVDHGLESLEDRERAGKPETGCITLEARHDGGGLLIQVTDDGRGIDRVRLLATAVERGIVREGQKLTHGEIDELIFAAGLSTAEKVTQVSGRGVGMDVVRDRVQALRGSIHVESVPGRGTTLSIRLPLTLAIIPGFEIEVAGDAFVIPMESVLECVDLPAGAPLSGVLSLRDEALPYLSLAEHFGLDDSADSGASTKRGGRPVVVVVRDAHRRAGLVVRSLKGQTQAVIRALGPCFRGIAGLSGATIRDDGRVGHILDVPVLLRRAEESARASAA